MQAILLPIMLALITYDIMYALKITAGTYYNFIFFFKQYNYTRVFVFFFTQDILLLLSVTKLIVALISGDVSSSSS